MTFPVHSCLFWYFSVFSFFPPPPPSTVLLCLVFGLSSHALPFFFVFTNVISLVTMSASSTSMFVELSSLSTPPLVLQDVLDADQLSACADKV